MRSSGAELGGDLEEAFRQHSPLTYAPNVETPVLLLHGEDDVRCPMEQSEQYFVALKRQGKEVELVRFPGLLPPLPGGPATPCCERSTWPEPSPGSTVSWAAADQPPPPRPTSSPWKEEGVTQMLGVNTPLRWIRPHY